MPGNMFIPPPQQKSNPIMGLLGQLALMKVQHDWSMEERQMQLEAKKLEQQEAKAEVRSKSRSEAMMQGAEFSTPSGPVADPSVAYQQPAGSQYDPYYGQNVKAPPLAQPVLENGKVIGHVDRKGALHYLPKSDVDSVKGPVDVQKFEQVMFGKAVPELRGTPEYQKGYMDFIMKTKEQNPMLDWTSRQFEMQRQKEGSGLRTEFNSLPEVKNHMDIRSKYDIAKEAYNESKRSGTKIATDQALITMFNKITDPQSVVRESEYARTASDLSLLNRLKGKYEKWVSGGAGLTDEDRKAILDMSEKFYKVSEKKFKSREKEYRGYFTNIGFNPDQYLKTQGEQGSKAESMVSPPSKKEVRRGKEKGTGKTVIQYDDGTVGYAD